MVPGQMHAFFAVLKADFRSAVPYVVWAVLTVVVALAGPFGSYVGLDLPQRLVFWGVLMALGILAGTICRAAVHELLGLRDFRRGAFLTAMLSAAILTWPLYALADHMFDQEKALAPDHFEIALFIFATSLCVGAFRHSLGLMPNPLEGRAFAEVAEQDAPPEIPAPPLPRVVSRLDPALQGRLIAMTVRNHYVDVTTTAGQGSILMRFADAMAEATEESGIQIHRLHWVAWWAVTGVDKAEGKVWVTLAQDMRLPVSKSHRAKLEERGLL